MSGAPRRIRDYPDLTWLGTVLGAHGMRGEVKVRPETDDPEYYLETASFFVETATSLNHLDVAGMHFQKGQWLVAFAGVTSRVEAEAFKSARLLLPDEQLKPLAPGEHFQHRIQGCQVESTTGEPLGTIFQVVETGANDVYEVRHEGRTFLVPVVPHIVISVDTEAQKVVIDPISGLLDEELGK